MSSKQQFILLNEMWEKISHAYPLLTKDYLLGSIRVRVCGPNHAFLENMVRAFSHLEIQNCHTPDFTICLLDTNSTRVTLPALNWNQLLHYGYRGYQDDDIYFHFFKYIGALSCIDTTTGCAFYIVRDQTSLPWWVAGSPFVIILNQALKKRGLQLTHTAAVGNEYSAVLLTGKSGSGKSTTSLACAKAGLYVIGEDYCILESTAPPCVYSVYESAKWTPKTCEFFPEYQSFIVNTEKEANEKSLVYYQDFLAKQIKTSLPVRAVISLELNPTGETEIHQQTSAEGIKHLMLSTLSQLPGSNTKTLKYFMQLSQQLSFYQLKLGRDFEKNIAIIRSFLE